VASFAEHGYILGEPLAVALTLAERLGKPLLIEGPPGTGKTMLARCWAKVLGARLVRLQCWEGLDETKALYEWAYGKQMLYVQLLREHTRELTGDAATLTEAVGRLEREADAFFSEAFLLRRPLLEAILSEDPVVLLVDEIDRADEEFEAFLLEVLSEGQVTVPELGTLRAKRPLLAILTSNDTRELSDALRRRCLYHWIDLPDAEREARIIEAQVPGISEELARKVARFVASLRREDLRKSPGTAEAVDWAAALVASGAAGLSADAVTRTVGALLKTREDLLRVREHPGDFR
jgi:MoxR-like ATPase